MITGEERRLAKHCIEYAVANGADGIRVSLNKSVMDSCSMLNGDLDKVSHSADRSVFIYLYVDGRYGTFSTNRLEEKELEEFIGQAIVMVRMLGEDRDRRLPSPERMAKDARGGNELGLYDRYYEDSDSSSRLERAERMSIFDSARRQDIRSFRRNVSTRNRLTTLSLLIRKVLKEDIQRHPSTVFQKLPFRMKKGTATAATGGRHLLIMMSLSLRNAHIPHLKELSVRSVQGHAGAGVTGWLSTVLLHQDLFLR